MPTRLVKKYIEESNANDGYSSNAKDPFIVFYFPNAQARLTENKLQSYFELLHRNRNGNRKEFRQFFDSENTCTFTSPDFREALINCGMTVEGSSIEKRFRDGDNDFGMQDRPDEKWSRNAPGKYIFNFPQYIFNFPY